MIDRDFGHWLAGFIDGEGCFYITKDKSRSPWRARFSLSLRIDDRPIIDECHQTTGLGTVHEYQGQSGHRVARWVIQSRSDAVALVGLLDEFPLRAKKRRDFEVWRQAVLTQKAIRTGCKADNSGVNAAMASFKQQLTEVRKEGLPSK